MFNTIKWISTAIEMITFPPPFILLMWYIKLLDFLILTQLYIPESISIWSWFIMFHEHSNYTSLGVLCTHFFLCYIYKSWRRKWQPTPVFLPRKSRWWRSLVGYSPWGRKGSDTTEQLHFHNAMISIYIDYSLINGISMQNSIHIFSN